jgi:Ca2+/H+ antiporter, TMEM165/GDT1 family
LPRTPKEVTVEPFLLSFGAIFLAEMGDKTQLVALAFATRFRPGVVLAGVAAATLVVHLFSVALGEVLGVTLPRAWVAALAGAAFIGFGLWTLRGDSLDNDVTKGPARFGPFLTVAIAFFLAELGDKTMLATVTLAGQLREALPVWLGSTAGMVMADGIAVVVGVAAGKRIPERMVKLVAGGLFIVSGLWLLASALF